jgi:hypothetical protein
MVAMVVTEDSAGQVAPPLQETEGQVALAAMAAMAVPHSPVRPASAELVESQA